MLVLANIKIGVKIDEYIIFKEFNHCTDVMESEDKYHFSPFKAICGAGIYLATYFLIVVSMTAFLFHGTYF